MSRQVPNGGQLSLLLPINSAKIDRSAPPPPKSSGHTPTKEVSYSSVLDSLRRKGLAVPKK